MSVDRKADGVESHGVPGSISYRLDLEYDGTAFGGWARQPGRRTVQGELEGALQVLLRRPVRLRVAGRTARGVHASGQGASLKSAPDLDVSRLRLGLNALLPPDVAVKEVLAADDFDARAALSRTYRYRLWLSPVRPALERSRLWHVYRRLDVGLLQESAELFVGRRDWRALTPSAALYRSCVREVHAARWRPAIRPEGASPEAGTPSTGELLLGASHMAGRGSVAPDSHVSQTAASGSGVPPGSCEWVFEVTAGSFLHMMVRVMVGSMVDVAAGRLTLDELRRGIAAGERGRLGRTAPPHGLCLVGVEYEA